MYHQPSKRKLIIQRVVIYGLMTFSVIALVVVLIFVMLGYQFNSNDGKIEQGGLVQFDSQPAGATVTIDGNKFGTQTVSKTTMTAGQHTITMGRNGYDTWQKTVNVVPGAVLWLNYARLVPTDLPVKDVTELSGASSAAASTDKKTLAIQENASTAAIQLADISRDTPTFATLTLPDDSYTHPDEGKTSHFTIETWDPDDRYLLMKHTYNDDKTEWIIVDSEDSKNTKNLTTLLDIQATKVVFSNGDSKILYAQIGSDVRKINLSDATLSRPLITNVAQFALYSDTMITYTTGLRGDGTRDVGYYTDGADQPRVVRTVTDDGVKPLRFIVGRYFTDTFQAIAYGDTVEIMTGDLPRDSKTALSLKAVATTKVPGGVDYIENKTNGRFFVAQHGSTSVIYDLELKKSTQTKIKGSSELTTRLQWLDNYMLWNDQDGTLRFYEFDGANQHDIMSVVPGMTVSLSPTGKYLYGITKSDKGTYHLSRVQMILNQ